VKDNVVIVTSGVVKKMEQKNKGELIEQNVDGLEVSRMTFKKIFTHEFDTLSDESLFCTKYSSEEEKDDFDTVSNMNVKQQGKKEVKIDHANIEYAPFRSKLFYCIRHLYFNKYTKIKLNDVDFFNRGVLRGSSGISTSLSSGGGCVSL